MCGLWHVSCTFVKLLNLSVYMQWGEIKVNDVFMGGGNKREICTLRTSFSE